MGVEDSECDADSHVLHISFGVIFHSRKATDACGKNGCWVEKLFRSLRTKQWFVTSTYFF